MHTSPRTLATTLPALLLLLSGCAAMNDATMQALASSAPTLAVVGDRVYAGEALLYTDRSATLQLRSEDTPALSCMGTMHYTSSTGGVIHLRCSDGLQTQMPYTALTETSGQGSGRLDAASVSLTYGLAPEAARAWLIPPPGKRLTVSGSSLRLE